MNAESVKARLKNFAVSSGCTFQDALVYYGLERTIYRLSVSPYASHFVLKGGIFLYAIFDRKYERATTDVDLLARRISNSAEEMKDVFRNIFAQDADDALVFDLASITAEDITEFKEYHGLHISAVAYLDRTRIPIGIDIGFGDVIYPDAVEMDFPVILDMEAIPEIVLKELNSHIWAGDLYSETIVEEYFENTPMDGIRWSLDYNGVTFYFGADELSDMAIGGMSATVSFADARETSASTPFL